MNLTAVLFMLVASAPIPELQQDFEAGTERALQGDLKGAAGLYQSILERGGVHPDVYFNLGNVYAEMGRPVDAIVAYERALRLAPNDEDVKTNLGLVRAELAKKRKKSGLDDLEAESLTLVDALEPLVAPLPIPLFAYGVIICNFLVFAAIWLRRKSPRTSARRTWVVVLVLSGLFGLFATLVTYGHWAVAQDPRAVVLKAGEMRQGPDARFKPAGTVDAGARVRILEEDRGWLKVQPTDGTMGWLNRDVLTRI